MDDKVKWFLARREQWRRLYTPDYIERYFTLYDGELAAIEAALAPSPVPLADPSADDRPSATAREWLEAVSQGVENIRQLTLKSWPRTHSNPPDVEEWRTHIACLIKNCGELKAALRSPSTLLHEPSKHAPDGCYCPPNVCQAPVVMGRQTPCRRSPSTSPGPSFGQNDASSLPPRDGQRSDLAEHLSDVRAALTSIVSRFDSEDNGGLQTRPGLAWAMCTDAKAALGLLDAIAANSDTPQQLQVGAKGAAVDPAAVRKLAAKWRKAHGEPWQIVAYRARADELEALVGKKEQAADETSEGR